MTHLAQRREHPIEDCVVPTCIAPGTVECGVYVRGSTCQPPHPPVRFLRVVRCVETSKVTAPDWNAADRRGRAVLRQLPQLSVADRNVLPICTEDKSRAFRDISGHEGYRVVALIGSPPGCLQLPPRTRIPQLDTCLAGWLGLNQTQPMDFPPSVSLPDREIARLAWLNCHCPLVRLTPAVNGRGEQREPRSVPAPRPAIRMTRPAACDHWISRSARARTDDGIVSPSARAVLRLMTRVNVVGRSTGRSPARAPLRSLST